MPGLRRHPHLTALALYALLAVAATWPLVLQLGSSVAGGAQAPLSTVWGSWWWRRALVEGRWPLACDVLRWPAGAGLAYQAWDLPAALTLAPLWAAGPLVPPALLHNVWVLAAFPLTGFFTYLLGRELWGGWAGPFLAGVLHAFGAWHFAHAQGLLSLPSAQWATLYFLGLVRTARHRGPAGPALAGAALALAGGASCYHLLACAAGSAVLVGAWAWRERGALLDGALLRRGLLLLGVFALLAGWQHVAMLRARAAEPLAGAHPAALASADLRTLLAPGPAAWWGSSGLEQGVPLGAVLLVLALAGAIRSRAARPWLLAAGVGMALALGPVLHVAGRAFPRVPMPYAGLERTLPPLAFAGYPARLGWLAAFCLAVAAGFALAELARLGRRGAALAVALTALAVAEAWPRSLHVEPLPAPGFLSGLARDRERWAVLDATAGDRPLWNQLLHDHPQVGGPLTRPPARLDRWLAETPALRPFFGDGQLTLPAPEAVRALQQLAVRFVVVDAGRLPQAQALALPLAYQGEGLWIYEVPPAAPDA